jgi:hypothetical protein
VITSYSLFILCFNNFSDKRPVKETFACCHLVWQLDANGLVKELLPLFLWNRTDNCTEYHVQNEVISYRSAYFGRPTQHANGMKIIIAKHLFFYIYVSNLMSLIVVILLKTSLHVSGVPCPSSGDTTSILPGQPLW